MAVSSAAVGKRRFRKLFLLLEAGVGVTELRLRAMAGFASADGGDKPRRSLILRRAAGFIPAVLSAASKFDLRRFGGPDSNESHFSSFGPSVTICPCRTVSHASWHAWDRNDPTAPSVYPWRAPTAATWRERITRTSVSPLYCCRAVSCSRFTTSTPTAAGPTTSPTRPAAA